MDCAKKVIQKLNSSGATFVAYANGQMLQSFDRGIAPIMSLLIKDKNALRGACVADKVIGKAAALLLIYAGVDQLFAKTISAHATQVLSQSPIRFEYSLLVPHIINRKGDGMCPMEQLVLSIEDPDEAYAQLSRNWHE